MTWPAVGYAHTGVNKARVAERFRHHINTPRRPHGRIFRVYRCCYCRVADVPTEAHHPDYTRPFLVSWLCTSCHRRAEAGSIVLRKRHLFDYASLVNAEPHRWRNGDRGARSQDVNGYRRRRVLKGVPF